MDSNTMMAIYVGLGILVIFYFVVTFFSAKTWKIPHVLLALCVFFGCAVFLLLAAGTLKTHQVWREIYLQTQKDLAEQALKNELLKKGYGADETGNIEKEEKSIDDLKQALNQELRDRARVWRGCMPGALTGNSVSLNVAPADGAAAPGDLGIPVGMVLFAFKETPPPADSDLSPDARLPSAYLGEYEVTQATGNSLTLSPTLPLDPSQIANVNNVNSTWVLYEMMPVDSRDSFADLRDPDTAHPGGPEADFREKLQRLMPQNVMMLSDAGYKNLIDEYCDDQGEADETVHPAERIWKRVRFLDDHTFDVDANDESPHFAMQYYSEGRAVPASLRFAKFDPDDGKFIGSGEIEFGPGDEAILDSRTVDGYTDEESGDRVQGLVELGVCEELGQVFYRELRDYASDFHDNHSRMKLMEREERRLNVDIGVLKLAKVDANVYMTYRSGEKESMLADVERVTAERNLLQEYMAQLEAQWHQLRNDMSLLYRTNNALASELARYQDSLSRAINQRTTPVEAKAPSAPTPP